jgi:hypothetical protein
MSRRIAPSRREVPYLKERELEDEALLLLAEYGREHSEVTALPIPVDEIIESREDHRHHRQQDYEDDRQEGVQGRDPIVGSTQSRSAVPTALRRLITIGIRRALSARLPYMSPEQAAGQDPCGDAVGEGDRGFQSRAHGTSGRCRPAASRGNGRWRPGPQPSGRGRCLDGRSEHPRAAAHGRTLRPWVGARNAALRIWLRTGWF